MGNTLAGSLSGSLLIVGAAVSFAGASGLGVGVEVFTGSTSRQLEIIAGNQSTWLWANTLLALGVIFTILGLAALAGAFKDTEGSLFAGLGLTTFTFGAVMWFVSLAFRITVMASAAEGMALSRSLPSYFLPVAQWAHSLLFIYTALAYASLILFGVAFVKGGGTLRRLGWILMVTGPALLILLFGVREPFPFIIHLILLPVGIAMAAGRRAFSAER